MPPQEIADKLAEACGWHVDPNNGCWTHENGNVFCDDTGNPEGHPFPVGDLNAVAGALPEGWVWSQLYQYMNTGQWHSAAVRRMGEVRAESPLQCESEWEARALCAIAAHEKHKEPRNV